MILKINKILVISVIIMLAVTPLMIGLTQQSESVLQSEGSPAIGGDFTLTDANNKTVRATDFRGKLMLVAFGFTDCPDICPLTLATYSRTLELLADKAQKVAMVFITIDPERDTPARLKEYGEAFDKRITLLTGSDEDIKNVTALYKAYYAKHENKDGANKDKGYSMDHSSFIYIMDRDGKYTQHFPYSVAPEDLAKALEPLL